MPLVHIPRTTSGSKLSASPRAYEASFKAWIDSERLALKVRKASSQEMYQHMWAALSAWAVGQGVAIDALTAIDLENYLRSRSTDVDLSPRYAWRLLRLVDRVLEHRAQLQGAPVNEAAAFVLEARPEIRFAQNVDKDLPPDFLSPADAKRLVDYLTARSADDASEAKLWKDVRNRASVALMLGAGLSPHEVRALKTSDVVQDRGDAASLKLRIGRSAKTPTRQTPVARWAGRVLQRCLDVRTEQRVPGDVLFPSTRGGGAWGKVSQYESTRAVLEAAGIDAVEGGSYRLRHTFAIRQLRRGKAATEVAAWLGVKDPQVMERYRNVLITSMDLA